MRFSTHERTGVGSGIGLGRTFLSVFLSIFSRIYWRISSTLLLNAVRYYWLKDGRPYAPGFLFIEIPSLIAIIRQSRFESDSNFKDGIRSYLILSFWIQRWDLISSDRASRSSIHTRITDKISSYPMRFLEGVPGRIKLGPSTKWLGKPITWRHSL